MRNRIVKVMPQTLSKDKNKIKLFLKNNYYESIKLSLSQKNFKIILFIQKFEDELGEGKVSKFFDFWF